MLASIFFISFFFLIAIGLAFAFMPMMPAIPYMFAVALIFGLLDKFKHIGAREIGVLGVILLLSLCVDYFSGIIGAKYGGASNGAIGWGFVGLLIGLLLMPPFGAFIGLYLAVLISEILHNRSHLSAQKAASGALMGSLVGMAINVFLALLFAGLFIVLVVF